MNANKLITLAAAICAASMVLPASADKRPMALVVMVDGLRADATETGSMPNLERLRAGKWQPGYKAAWSVTGQITPSSVPLPSSAPNHVSIATGYAPAQHGVTSNDILQGGTSSSKPTWLKRVIDAKDGATALFVYSWAPDGNLAPNEGVEYVGGTDVANAATLAARLADANAPDATLYFIDCVDAAGHAGYYYPMSDGYRAAVAAADGYIGACLNAIASRPTFAEEDWLIAVTSDHGGYSKNHGDIVSGAQGGICQVANSVPLVISGTGVTQGRIIGMPYNFDVAASALNHFGVAVPDLQATLRDGAAETARTLNDGLVAYLPFNGSATANAVAGSAVTPEVPEGKTTPDVAANGMVGGCANINTNKFLRLAGSDTGSLAYEDSGRSFTAVIWTKYDVGKQGGDPVIFGNKHWSGAAPGVIFCAKVSKPIVSGSKTQYTGAAFHASLNNNNRIDIQPFECEGASVWTFYAVTRNDDGVITVYQGRSDGTLGWTCGTLGSFTLDSGYPFCIGQSGRADYGAHFVGSVDDFALWTRGLSHEDIRRIYENGRAGMELGDLLKVDAHDAPTMEVADDEGEYTLTFGGRRTGTYGLYVAYGADDAGSDKYAWESFAKVADIPAATTTYTYTVPDALKAANAKFRFFLMQTDSLPYVKEVAYAHSDGAAWIDSGIAPRRDMTAEFNVYLTAKNTTGNYDWLFGSFGTSKSSNYGLNHFYNLTKTDSHDNNKWDQELTGGGVFKGDSFLDTAYHIAFGVASYAVNGVEYTTGASQSGFVETGYPINIFRNEKIGAGKGADGNQYDQTMVGYFSNFSLYTPRRRVRDYVPVEDSEGTVGMFDAVTGLFQPSAGTALTAGADLDATRYGWVRCVSGNAYSASDTTPATAAYTGLGANPLDFADSANWACTNVYGTALDGAVPTVETAVTVSGETAFAVPSGAATPACASLRFLHATPTNVTDWSGLDFSKVTADSVIDIKGRTFFLADETSAALSAFTITDTSTGEPGTVRISVASGSTLANAVVALNGNLKLRKEGEGVFSAAKASQAYTGGTDVIAGTIRIGSSGTGHFGGGVVYLPADTVFDVLNYNASAASVVLAGGTLQNSATTSGTLPRVLRLTEDSTIRHAHATATNNDMFIPAGCEWNLGGKTLSVVMTGNDSDLNMDAGAVNVISNGTLKITVNTAGSSGKGYFAIRRLAGRDGLKLDTGRTYPRLQSGAYVSSVMDFTSNPVAGANAINSSGKYMEIYGRFTPQSALGFNMTMMDGSTLDLSKLTGAFSCNFSTGSGGTGSQKLSFAAGTVTVNLEGRDDLKTIAKSASPYIVTWTTKPADTVSFALDESTAGHGYKCEVCDAGLKLIPPPGFSIILR